MNIRVLLDQIPVELGNFVVLAEGVVIPALGTSHLVAISNMGVPAASRVSVRKFLT
jgi:hypothetical protein